MSVFKQNLQSDLPCQGAPGVDFETGDDASHHGTIPGPRFAGQATLAQTGLHG
jgi:hypothetical protein